MLPMVAARALAANPVTRSLVLQGMRAGSAVAGGIAFIPSGVLRVIWTRIAPLLGLTAAAEIIIPEGAFDLFDFTPSGGFQLGAGLGGGNLDGVDVVKRWEANGTPFVRLADGRMGARRKDGVWRFWRPKKPIVLYRGGAGDLRTLLKADTAVSAQLKKLEKSMRRRGIIKPTPRRRPHTHAKPIVMEQGSGDVQVG